MFSPMEDGAWENESSLEFLNIEVVPADREGTPTKNGSVKVYDPLDHKLEVITHHGITKWNCSGPAGGGWTLRLSKYIQNNSFEVHTTILGRVRPDHLQELKPGKPIGFRGKNLIDWTGSYS